MGGFCFQIGQIMLGDESEEQSSSHRPSLVLVVALFFAKSANIAADDWKEGVLVIDFIPYL